MGSPLCVPGSVGAARWRPKQQKARPKPGVFVVRVLKNHRWTHRPDSSNRRSTVVANGFDRAAFHGLFAGGFFFGGRRLLHDVRITSVIPAGVILRRSFAAQVAVDALVVDEVLARDVLGIPICNVSHKSKSGVSYRPRKPRVQAAFSIFCSVSNQSCHPRTMQPSAHRHRAACRTSVSTNPSIVCTRASAVAFSPRASRALLVSGPMLSVRGAPAFRSSTGKSKRSWKY